MLRLGSAMAPILAATLLTAPAEAFAQADPTPSAGPAPKRAPDVIYEPTPQPVVHAMLKMARVKKGDVIYDLGSGDGRIPIMAARRYGARAVGIEIRPELIAEAEANAKAAKVSHLASFRNDDLFTTDFSEATVVTLFLLPSLNVKLRPKLLRELRPGARIISHTFLMGDWEPEEQQTVYGRTIYRWTVPPR